MAAQPKVDLSQWQDHFDFLLPKKEMLRTDEVARALACDEKTVIRLFESGDLCGHDIKTKGQRVCPRYRRDSVILLIARRANYAPTDLRNRLVEVLSHQPKADLVLLQGAVAELLRRKA